MTTPEHIQLRRDLTSLHAYVTRAIDECFAPKPECRLIIRPLEQARKITRRYQNISTKEIKAAIAQDNAKGVKP